MGIIRVTIWAIAVMATPVGAEQLDIDRRFAPLFDKAAEELNAGQPAKALETVAPAVTEYERAYAGEKRRIYCGISPTQTVAALARAANDKMSAVAVGEGYCTALYLRAFALVDVGQVSEAELGFLRLVELAPFNARYVYELANIRRMTKRYDLALEGYRTAAGLAGLAPSGREKAERGAAWRQIGWILVEQGKWDEAEAIYRDCLKLDPDDKKATAELGYIAENRPKTN